MDWKLVLQLTGIVLGLLYLWLEYRADIRLWIVGLIMPCVHGALYFKAGLYADCSMQLYYILAGLYGWFVWQRASRGRALRAGRSRRDSELLRAAAATDAADAAEQGRRADDRIAGACAEARAEAGTDTNANVDAHANAERRIRHTPWRCLPALAAAYAIVHAAIYFVLLCFTNSTVPFWDALTTALSVVAMWMLSRKFVEQWLVWGVVDAITVGLYLYKQIPFTAGLYTLYTVLAVIGYLRWRRMARRTAGA